MSRPILFAATLAAASIAAAAVSAQAPEPAKPVDLDRLYQGRWLEIGRTPMKLTDGCVAGTTTYTRGEKPDEVMVRDTCRDDTPSGKEKAIKGRGRILDPGTNAKLRVRYALVITWDYWILDRADDYSWFISSDPKLEKLFIFTREVPSEALRARLVERAGELGYDVSKLEFPAQPPA